MYQQHVFVARTLSPFSELQIFHSCYLGVKTSAPFLKVGVEDLLSFWPGSDYDSQTKLWMTNKDVYNDAILKQCDVTFKIPFQLPPGAVAGVEGEEARWNAPTNF